jgi:hypothetical protein
MAAVAACELSISFVSGSCSSALFTQSAIIINALFLAAVAVAIHITEKEAGRHEGGKVR